MNLICLQFSQVVVRTRDCVLENHPATDSRLQQVAASSPRGPASRPCVSPGYVHLRQNVAFFFSLLHTYGDGWGNYCSLSSRWTIISTIRRQKMLVQVEIGKESTWRAQCQASAARPRYFQIHHRVRIQRHWPVWYSSSSISVDVPNLLRKTAASFWSLPLTFGLIRRLLGIVLRIASLRRAKTWHDT